MKKIIPTLIVIMLFTTKLIGQIALGNGLAASYSFTGNANDDTGGGLNGTPYSTTLTTDRFGNTNQAYSFNGSTSYINFGNILNNVFAGVGNKFSISVWIKPSVNNMSNNMIVAKSADAACSEDQRQFYFRIYNGKIMFSFSSTLNTGNGAHASGLIGITDVTHWYHVVVLYDGTVTTNGGLDRVKLYIDNVQDVIFAGSPTLGTLGNIQVAAAPLGVGNYMNTSGAVCNSSYTFNGKIDDIRIYNRPLNTTEIDAIYNGTTDVGISENENVVDCTIYPNPSTGKINLSLSNASSSTKIKLYDIMGRILYYENLSLNSDGYIYSIDLSNQTKGIYFIQIQTENGRTTKKIVIQD